MVKLFIGNLPREATGQEIRSLFEQYGKALEYDVIKNYGFVHMEDETAAEDAIHNLHRYELHGVNINVEASKNKGKASTKLHVGNVSPTCTNKELKGKCAEYGPFMECDMELLPPPLQVLLQLPLHITGGIGAPCVALQAQSPLLEKARVPGMSVSCPKLLQPAGIPLNDMARYEQEQYADRAQYSAF
ncbi:RNA-binding protein 4 [Heterocephalus glaber]|uniref:RNA-binding protein 4 n=1 Tax=Heterocephalus glaber TaxID=10181 RepID=G5ASG6_HETGA|nr:RNA-binding protein 4 [Heterocephalus glaber]